jgi:hypothetical protein
MAWPALEPIGWVPSWAYLGWEEPEEEVAVVSLIHSDVASITLHVLSWKRTDQTQFFP